MWVPIRGASACVFLYPSPEIGTRRSGPRSKLAAPSGKAPSSANEGPFYMGCARGMAWHGMGRCAKQMHERGTCDHYSAAAQVELPDDEWAVVFKAQHP